MNVRIRGAGFMRRALSVMAGAVTIVLVEIPEMSDKSRYYRRAQSARNTKHKFVFAPALNKRL